MSKLLSWKASRATHVDVLSVKEQFCKLPAQTLALQNGGDCRSTHADRSKSNSEGKESNPRAHTNLTRLILSKSDQI